MPASIPQSLADQPGDELFFLQTLPSLLMGAVFELSFDVHQAVFDSIEKSVTISVDLLDRISGLFEQTSHFRLPHSLLLHASIDAATLSSK
jgi:hypothetical protein